jgi:hypothetical protein
MKINEKYIEALKAINDWTTVSNWAIKVGEMYPDLLEKANKEAANHKRPSTGLRELAARISSWISTGDFAGIVEVDESERPRKVRYLSGERKAALIERDIDEDIEPLNRAQKIKQDLIGLSTKDSYRLEEMQAIADTLNSYFRLDFEVDHSQALLNPDQPGQHHPDNLQLLLKSHNRMKNNSNWDRFTLDEQIEYIKSAIKIQGIVAKKMKVDLDEKVIGSIVERLRLVY